MTPGFDREYVLAIGEVGAGVFWADEMIVRKARVEPKKIVRMSEGRTEMKSHGDLPGRCGS